MGINFNPNGISQQVFNKQKSAEAKKEGEIKITEPPQNQSYTTSYRDDWGFKVIATVSQWAVYCIDDDGNEIPCTTKSSIRSTQITVGATAPGNGDSNTGQTGLKSNEDAVQKALLAQKFPGTNLI